MIRLFVQHTPTRLLKPVNTLIIKIRHFNLILQNKRIITKNTTDNDEATDIETTNSNI